MKHYLHRRMNRIEQRARAQCSPVAHTVLLLDDTTHQPCAVAVCSRRGTVELSFEEYARHYPDIHQRQIYKTCNLSMWRAI